MAKMSAKSKNQSLRTIEDKRLLGRIKQFWLKSGCAYGYRNMTKGLKDHGESCGKTVCIGS